MPQQRKIIRALNVAATVVLAVGLAVAVAPPSGSAPAPSVNGYTLFRSPDDAIGSKHYTDFRIPAIIMTRPGTLVAFAEGRFQHNNDFGDVDIVMKYSTNNGNSWSSLLPVATGRPATFGNPTPVYQPNTNPATGGTIFLFAEYTTATKSDDYTYGNRTVQLLTRAVGADGVPRGNWTIKDLTTTLKPRSITGFDAVGPGNGIRLTRGPNAGALVIPALGRLFYSTDRGATWHLQEVPGNSTLGGRSGAEGTVAERSDGSLYLNYRGTRAADPYRLFATGTLGGALTSWDCHNGPHDTLTEPLNASDTNTAKPPRSKTCRDTTAQSTVNSGSQGSTIRYNFDKPGRLLFLHAGDPLHRTKIRISISYDDGVTWDKAYRTVPSPTKWKAGEYTEGAYSSMTATSDHNIAALVEAHVPSTKRGIVVFHKFTIKWILNGKTEPAAST